MKKNLSCKSLIAALLCGLMLMAVLPLTAYAQDGPPIFVDPYYSSPDQAIIVEAPPFEPAYTEQPAEVAPYQDSMFQYAHYGTVASTRLTVRREPDSNSSGYGKITNGQSCKIVGRYGGWLILDLSSLGLPDAPEGIGFVKSNLIRENPYWIATTQYTLMYATPWQKTNLENGEQSDRVFLVLEEEYPFYAVQCTEHAAGTSFIYQSDVGRYSRDGENLYVCAEDKVPLLDSPYGNQISTIDRFTIVNVDSNYGDYTRVTVNFRDYNAAYSGWVKTQYIQKIAN